jgi:hypothetical protein
MVSPGQAALDDLAPQRQVGSQKLARLTLEELLEQAGAGVVGRRADFLLRLDESRPALESVVSLGKGE